MTTIAYRKGTSGIGIVAADTGITCAGCSIGEMQKIIRNDKGDVAAVTGNAVWAWAFLEWFRKREQGCSPSIGTVDGHMIAKGAIFRECGRIEVFEDHGIYVVTAPYYSIGSGRDVALGAMFHGASAPEAVRAAIAHDESTWGDITELWMVRQ